MRRCGREGATCERRVARSDPAELAQKVAAACPSACGLLVVNPLVHGMPRAQPPSDRRTSVIRYACSTCLHSPTRSASAGNVYDILSHREWVGGTGDGMIPDHNRDIWAGRRPGPQGWSPFSGGVCWTHWCTLSFETSHWAPFCAQVVPSSWLVPHMPRRPYQRLACTPFKATLPYYTLWSAMVLSTLLFTPTCKARRTTPTKLAVARYRPWCRAWNANWRTCKGQPRFWR